MESKASRKENFYYYVKSPKSSEETSKGPEYHDLTAAVRSDAKKYPQLLNFLYALLTVFFSERKFTEIMILFELR